VVARWRVCRSEQTPGKAAVMSRGPGWRRGGGVYRRHQLRSHRRQRSWSSKR
jgi:hypothetical protein